MVANKTKKNKGTKYAANSEFAEEILEKNVKHAAQQNPGEGAARK